MDDTGYLKSIGQVIRTTPEIARVLAPPVCLHRTQEQEIRLFCSPDASRIFNRAEQRPSENVYRHLTRGFTIDHPGGQNSNTEYPQTQSRNSQHTIILASHIQRMSRRISCEIKTAQRENTVSIHTCRQTHPIVGWRPCFERR
jgi:hypothetical protein